MPIQLETKATRATKAWQEFMLKEKTSMQHYSSQAFTDIGKPAGGASIAVKLAGTNTNATIYSDDGVTLKSNPFVTNSLGQFDFYAASGKYDITVSGTQITTFTLANQVVFDPFEQNSADTAMSVRSITLSSPPSPLAASQVDRTGLTAAVANTTWFTPAQTGFYLVLGIIDITAPGGAAANTLQIQWTDADTNISNAVTQTWQNNMMGAQGLQLIVVVWAKANTTISYLTTINGTGETYSIRLRAIPLG
jgi:hypothetical protein